MNPNPSQPPVHASFKDGGPPRHVDSRVVVISGHTGGLGRAILEECLESSVIQGVVGISRSSLDRMDARLLQVRGDIASERACRDAADAARERFPHIDAVIHCAGLRPQTRIDDARSSAWIEALSVNLVGAYFMVRAFLPALLAGSGGSIVTMLSAEADSAPVGRSAYAASKAALRAWTGSLAAELSATSVAVFGYYPGNLCTTMNPNGTRAPAAAARDVLALVRGSRLPQGWEVWPAGDVLGTGKAGSEIPTATPRLERSLL